MKVLVSFFFFLAPPPTGVYFMLKGDLETLYSSLISDIAPQPADCSDPRSTLVCVTYMICQHCLLVVEIIIIRLLLQ